MKHKFKVGENVIVTWLDSGLVTTGEPEGEHNARLVFNVTHGRVSYFGPDPVNHERMCSPKRCNCTYLELVMCSSGLGDKHSDIAGIWGPSIVEVQRVKSSKSG